MYIPSTTGQFKEECAGLCCGRLTFTRCWVINEVHRILQASVGTTTRYLLLRGICNDTTRNLRNKDSKWYIQGRARGIENTCLCFSTQKHYAIYVLVPKSIMKFMFSTVYRVTQKDFYARPYMCMSDLRHNNDNDELELITPHIIIIIIIIIFIYCNWVVTR